MTRTCVALLIVAVGLIGCSATGPGSSSAEDADPSPGDEAGGVPPTGAKFGVINARIRNFTDMSADVTLRFGLFAQTIRLIVLRVPGNTSTTVIGPEEADLLEVSGVAQDGTALPQVEFRYGEDFFAGTEAVYIIGIQGDAAVPPALIFLEPIEDIEVVAGDQLEVLIADEDRDSSALIDFYLDPFEAAPTVGVYTIGIRASM